MRPRRMIPIALLALLATRCDETRPKPAATDERSAAAGDRPGDPSANRADTGRAEPGQPGQPGQPTAGARSTPGAPGSDHARPPAAQRPLYYERDLTAADLKDRTLRELHLLRNTIFARAGNSFRKSWLEDHFKAQSWYKPTDKLDRSKLTEYDWANAKRIAQFERAITSAELEQRKEAVLAAIVGQPTAEQIIELKLLSSRIGSWVAPEGVPRETASPLEDVAVLDTKILVVDDMGELSRRDLRILRNTIYARRGRPFKSRILRQYFSTMSWYKPDPEYSDKRLTKIDRRNIRLIKLAEEELGGPLSEGNHGRILQGKEEDDFFILA